MSSAIPSDPASSGGPQPQFEVVQEASRSLLPGPEPVGAIAASGAPEATAKEIEDESSGDLTANKLRALGVLSPYLVDSICAGDSRAQFLVDGLLPAKSIAIAAGDSTIGKSPLMYQLGVCIAAGVPFLGRSIEQGRVLYLDLENTLHDSKTIRDALVRFLGLSAPPEDFLVSIEPRHDLERLIAEVKPRLVIIDSLRAFAPEATSKNRDAAEWLNTIRQLARKYAVCFVIVHHLRKPSADGGMHYLGPCRVSDWMLEMEGPRAFVNQTDVRIALEEGNHNPAALRMKWSRRVYGDSPLVLLERVVDEDGEPAGYRHLTGAALLTEERRAAFDKLNQDFRFKDAQLALNRGGESTDNFLNECINLGVMVKIRKGHYRKVTPTSED
jgi:hypothetical protein